MKSSQKINKRNVIICLTFLMILVMIPVSVAWFVNGKENQAAAIEGKSVSLPYELAVLSSANKGAVSYNQSGEGASYQALLINDMVGATNAADGNLEEYSYVDGESVRTGEFYTTDEEFKNIIWRLEADGNANGIAPGCCGNLTFYIRPKQDGDMVVSISLELEGYRADVALNENLSFHAENLQKIEPGDAEEQAACYLKHHILFFREWTGAQEDAESPFYYKGFIEDGNLELVLTDCTKDRLIPVTIYWIWPKTFAQLTCISSQGNLADSSPNADVAGEATVSDLREYTIRCADELFASDDMIEEMANSSETGGETVYTFDPDKAKANLKDISYAFDCADQEIGTKIQYFLLRLTAE